MAASELWRAQTRPLDFVCDSEARKNMNNAKELMTDTIACSALITLPFPIRLPCIKVHKASWDKKPVQERRGEILLSLGALAQDVRAARTLSQPGCGSSLLERLERSVNNYLHIVTHLDIEQGEPECPALACLGQDTQDLGQVLRHFGLLLTGKLEWLIIELTQRCQTESLPFTS